MIEHFGVRKSLEEAQLQAGSPGKQEDIAASLLSEVVTSISRLQQDESGTIKLN
jgi:hypothetical protein